ncbi:hypothetical protein Taro_039159 [Colocasia esculenta]|uniref:Uncharacterized protein n=1 Tax=Colocasia esculenta TaxID=4460 RepID=A0A843W8L3_COLES|nr:hypothetical protein [Colocasia esculenta]
MYLCRSGIRARLVSIAMPRAIVMSQNFRWTDDLLLCHHHVMDWAEEKPRWERLGGCECSLIWLSAGGACCRPTMEKFDN